MTRPRHARPARLLRNVLTGILAAALILAPTAVVVTRINQVQAAAWQHGCPQATWKHILWLRYGPSCPALAAHKAAVS